MKDKIEYDKVPFYIHVFSVFVLFLSTTAVFVLVRTGSGALSIQNIADGDPLLKMLWTLSYGLTAVFIVKKLNTCVLILRNNIWIVLLLVVALLSTYWSFSPELTFRKSIALIGSSLFGLFIVAYYPLEKIIRLLLITLGLCIGASFFFVFFLPQLGIHHDVIHDGAWRGAFIHKNTLARAMVLGAVLSLFLFFSKGGNKLVSLLYMILCLVLVIFSQAKTALIVLTIVIISIPVVYFLRVNFKLLLAGLGYLSIICTIVIYWAYRQWEPLMASLDKDPTMTGRTELWRLIWLEISEKIWLGYGYSSFWLGWQGPSADIWQQTGWHPVQAHNGFLNLWLQLGAVGMFLLIVLIVRYIYQAVTMLRHSKEAAPLFPLIFLLYMILYNVTESDILIPNTLYWSLFMIFSFYLSSNWNKGGGFIVKSRD